ncbi:MAG: glycosyltransferase family 2 protein [Lactobacillaceae bacterium]|nr:glycosyltransferase family 2 protein [Lactobacillaceae bacterium]
MQKTKFSIIVPAYNAAPTIAETLNSILQQTLTDVEIIVIDDGSVDETSVIMKKFIDQDSRIKYVWQENAGPADAKNHGIQQATGQYTLFVDADDLLEENALTILDEALNGRENVMAVFSFTYFSADNEFTPWIWDTSSAEIDKMFTAVWNKVYSTTLLKQIKFPAGTLFEDVGFAAMAVLLANDVIVIPNDKPLYRYRSSQKSLTHDEKVALDHHLDLVTDFSAMFNFISERNITVSAEHDAQIYRLVNVELGSNILHLGKLTTQPKEQRNRAISEMRAYQLQVNQGRKIQYYQDWKKNLKYQLLVWLNLHHFYGLALALSKGKKIFKKGDK